MKKRFITVTLLIILCISLTACDKEDIANDTESSVMVQEELSTDNLDDSSDSEAQSNEIFVNETQEENDESEVVDELEIELGENEGTGGF